MIIINYFKIILYMLIGVIVSQVLSLGYAELPLHIKWILSDVYFSTIDLFSTTNNNTIKELVIFENDIKCDDIIDKKQSWIVNE